MKQYIGVLFLCHELLISTIIKYKLANIKQTLEKNIIAIIFLVYFILYTHLGYIISKAQRTSSAQTEECIAAAKKIWQIIKRVSVNSVYGQSNKNHRGGFQDKRE